MKKRIAAAWLVALCAATKAEEKGPAPELLQRVRVAEVVDGQTPQTSHVTIHGDFVYVRGAGKLHCYKRDAAGKLAAQRTTDLAGRATLVSAGGRLYAVIYEGNRPQKGTLVRYDVDADGSLTEKGKVECPGSAGTVGCEGLLAGPGDKTLYLKTNGLYGSPGSLVWFKLADDGAATTGGVLNGKGLNSSDKPTGASVIILSPDAKHLYAISQYDHAVAVIDVKADGTPVYREAVDLTPLAAKPGKGFPWPGLAVSPDGRHVYVALWSYGPKEANVVGIYQRDAATGALALVGKVKDLNVPKGMAIGFAPDGRSAWLGSLTNPVTALSRDPATGALAATGSVPRTNGPDRSGPQIYDLAHDAAKGHSYFADVFGELFVVSTKGTK